MLRWLILLLAIDQVSKRFLLSISHLHPELNLVHNTGIAFGLMEHRTLLIIGLNILLLALIYIYRDKLFGEDKLQRWAFIFILSGGFGNLLDRLLLGYVVDFIHLLGIPVFNLADVYINVGIFLIIAQIVLNVRKRI